MSTTQLPTEEDKEFKALKTVTRNEDSSIVQFTLETHTIDKEQKFIDPSNWFGILTPQSLKDAREKYEKAIELSVEALNVRSQISKNLEMIQKLKKVQQEFEKSEE